MEKKNVIYFETDSRNCYYNLAFEEYILTHYLDGDYLMLWQNDNTIVIGQNQSTEAEINRAFVEEHGINVVRRVTGGGAVYHDLGNLNYSFISDYDSIDHAALERFANPIVAALKDLGVEAEISGRNDILIEGRKVSGTAQRKYKHRILHHGTLLFDSDPGMVAGALRVDPEKLKAKGTQSVRSRIGNIREFLKEDMDLSAFWAYLKKTLAGEGMAQGTLSPRELEEIEELKRTKYDTWEWNYGRSPQYTLHNKRRYPGGGLEVYLTANQAVIRDIVFYGDFLSLRSMDDLTEALEGCPYRAEDVSAVLNQFPLNEFFGSITKDEVLDLIFHAVER